MQLRIVTPRRVCLDRPVMRIVAEAPDGSFGMLPRHIDFVTQLIPGLIAYQEAGGTERFAGIDHGTLVKCGEEVLVSARNVILGDDLLDIQRRVQEEFRVGDESERATRAAFARLEAQLVRRFLTLEEPA